MPPLRNTRHEQFALFVAQGKSATEAFRSAGYSTRGHASSLSGRAARLRANASIEARICELQASAANEVIIELRDVLVGLKRIAMADIGEAFDECGRAISPSKISLGLRLALDRFDATETHDPRTGTTTRKISIRLSSRLKALELLGNYLNIFSDKAEPAMTLEALVANSMSGSELG